MFTILINILFIEVFYYESKISWKAYTPKSVTVPLISFYSDKLIVPADYESPESSPKLTLHIRKMCSSPSPTWNIIALPGGPGANGRDISNNISNISKTLTNTSYCLHVIDHRGVGRTKPKLIEEADSKNWMKKIEELNKKTDFPLKTLTITNAAKDVLELVNSLKESNPNIKLGLIGSSYGSMLAHRILSIDPNMFDVCILDGYSVFERFSIDADEGLILDCIDDPICKSKLGPNPEDIRLVPSYLFDEEFNECTKILHQFLKTEYPSYRIDRKYWFQHYLEPFNSRSGFHRLLIAMIHHAWTCPDPAIYKEALKKFNAIKFQKENFKNSISSDKIDIQGSDTKDFNTFVNHYLRLSEIVRIYMEDGGEPDNCIKRRYPIGLVHNCNFWKNEKEQYNKVRQYLYIPDHLKSNSLDKECKRETLSMNFNIKTIFQKAYQKIRKFKTRFCLKKPFFSTLIDIKSIDHKVPSIKTVKTRIYLIHGTLDLNTPLAPALREFDRIETPEKLKFIIDSGDHCIAFNNPCMHVIMNEIFGKKSTMNRIFKRSKRRTDECIRESRQAYSLYHSWENVNNLNLWAKGRDDNDKNLKPLPKKPKDE